MRAPEKYSFGKVESIYQDLRDERSEWESEWRQISDFLLPGRGIYQTYTKPRKRKLTTANVINTIAEDALYVLTSGMHGRLTSPAMPWFRLAWSDSQLSAYEPLVAWLQEAELILQKALHASNFYSIINSFYIEYAGFGTGSLFIEEVPALTGAPFNFELQTAGEYCFAMGPNNELELYVRTIFMSPRQLVARFPDTVSDDIRKVVTENKAGADKVNMAILEFVARHEHDDKQYIRLLYDVAGGGDTYRRETLSKEPLEVTSFYEHPYVVARWNTIGSDTYGVGPGSRALPDIKRLQEMEKGFLMATHKGINPPLNAPARMRGKINSLPGGLNYYANPNEQISELYQIRFDYQGVGAAVERVEQRIQRNFFNDVFLAAARSPDASPLKAAQVHAQEQEKLLRLGPIVERLQSECFTKVLRRCFNILRRREWLPPLDPALEEMAGDFEIELVSPMAIAQRAVKSQGTDAFMSFVAQAAQFDESIMDNINADLAVRDRAEVEGVNLGILRTEQEVMQIRANRAKALQQKAAQEEALREQDQKMYMASEQANIRKTQAEAGQILADAQSTAADTGLLQ